MGVGEGRMRRGEGGEGVVEISILLFNNSTHLLKQPSGTSTFIKIPTVASTAVSSLSQPSCPCLQIFIKICFHYVKSCSSLKNMNLQDLRSGTIFYSYPRFSLILAPLKFFVSRIKIIKRTFGSFFSLS